MSLASLQVPKPGADLCGLVRRQCDVITINCPLHAVSQISIFPAEMQPLTSLAVNLLTGNGVLIPRPHACVAVLACLSHHENFVMGRP